MPLLVLLNGAPGTGKSTLAQRWAAAHPLSLALDIDRVRGMVGAWREQPIDAGMFARKLALTMTHTALEQGHHVVVPQLVGKPEFISALKHVSDQHSVPFIHVVLTAPHQTCVNRCRARQTTVEFAQDHSDLATTVKTASENIMQVADDEAIRVDTSGTIDAVFEQLVALVRGHEPLHDTHP